MHVMRSCDAIDACMYAMRSMQIDTCNVIDACMYAIQSQHVGKTFNLR